MAIVNALAFGRNVEVTRDIRFSQERRGLLDVYAPRGVIDAPMVVFFYGGGWEDGLQGRLSNSRRWRWPSAAS